MLCLRLRENDRHCLVIVTSTETPPKRDIHPAEIVGQFELIDGAPCFSRGTFNRGRDFTNLLHQSIARHGPRNPALVEAAKSQGDGYVYIIDGRTPDPQGRVPNEDIMGAFKVVNGHIYSESYEKFEPHCLYTERGFFELDPFFVASVLQDVEQLAGAPRTDA